MCMCGCVGRHTHTQVYTHIYIHTHTDLCVYECIHRHKYRHRHICTVCMYVQYVWMYVCMYITFLIHTQMHIPNVVKNGLQEFHVLPFISFFFLIRQKHLVEKKKITQRAGSSFIFQVATPGAKMCIKVSKSADNARSCQQGVSSWCQKMACSSFS